MVGHGAKFLNYLSDSATYFIADDPDHPSVSEAIDIYEKPVLTVSDEFFFEFFTFSKIFFIRLKYFRVNGFGFHYVPTECFLSNHSY